MFEDTKDCIQNPSIEEGQTIQLPKKNDKRTNNDLQNITRKIEQNNSGAREWWAVSIVLTRIPLMTCFRLIFMFKRSSFWRTLLMFLFKINLCIVHCLLIEWDAAMFMRGSVSLLNSSHHIVDTDPCNPDPCSHGRCKRVGTDYRCKCYSGYSGSTCSGNMNWVSNFGIIILPLTHNVNTAIVLRMH